jgi:hypothetical protein
MEVTEQMKNHYRGMWTNLDTDKSGFVGGAQAREFFTKSGLPMGDLGAIWGLADTTSDGRLNFQEFCIAFYLIQWRLAKKDLPSSLPMSLLESVGLGTPSTRASPTAMMSVPGGSLLGAINAPTPSHPTPSTQVAVPAQQAPPKKSEPSSLTSGFDLLSSFDPEPIYAPAPVVIPVVTPEPVPDRASRNARPVSLSAPLTLSHLQAAGIVDGDSPRGDSMWFISDEQKEIYKGYFQKAIMQDGSNAVTGATARALFGRSNLPNPTLAQIWVHSDQDKDGQLSLPEFMIAMHLINMALQGQSLPSILPDSFLLSVKVSAAPMGGSPATPTGPGRTPGNSLTAPLAPGSFDNSSNSVSIAHAAFLAQQQQQQQMQQQQQLLQQQLQQQHDIEQKRNEAQRIKQTIMDGLREKAALVQQLRQQQIEAVKVAKALLQQEHTNSDAQESVKDLEVEVERLKIKGASVREKQSFALQKLDAIQEQKGQFDALLEQKKQQYATEAASVAVAQRQLAENKSALQRQQQDIERLRAELETARKQKQMSQKVDPNMLHNRLTEEKVKQDSRGPTPAAVAAVNPRASIAVDFGSRAFVDDFGTKPNDQRSPAPTEFFPPDSDFARMTFNENDSFGKFAQKPRGGRSGVLDESSEGGAVADEFAPAAEDDFYHAPSSEAPVHQDDFFVGGKSDSRDSPYNKSHDDVPAPENDFVVIKSTPPSSTNPFPVSEDFVLSPNIPHRHPDDHHGHHAVSSTNPFPVNDEGDFSASAPNPFGAPVDSVDDLFKPLPESDASGGGKLDDDDFFAPLSQAGKQEAEELEKASSSSSSKVNAFDAPLFD